MSQFAVDQSINEGNDPEIASGDFCITSRSVPNLLTLASAVQDTIAQQLSGEQPSTKNGEGMGGGMGGMGGRMPINRALMEELREEIQASRGIITEDIKKKVKEAGLPEEMLKMMTNAPGAMPGMEGRPEGAMEGMPGGPRRQGQQTPGTNQSNNYWLLMVSGLLLLLMVLSIRVFNRRKN